jgi:hypothetical protein
MIGDGPFVKVARNLRDDQSLATRLPRTSVGNPSLTLLPALGADPLAAATAGRCPG